MGIVVRDVDIQVGNFLAGPAASPDALFIMFAGANDMIADQPDISASISSFQESINRLVMDGARQFLVFNLPPLGETPRFNGSQSTRDLYNMRSTQFNTALETMLGNVEVANSAVTIHRLDVNAMFEQVLTDPAAFGLTNTRDAATPGLEPGDTSYNTSLIAPNANQYLFWDELHPTATVHAILAQRALDLFRLPGDFNHDDVVDAADYIVWRNGVDTTHIPYDYEIWRSHFGQSGGGDVGSGATGTASAAIPEPTAGLLVCFAALGIVICAARRRPIAGDGRGVLSDARR
jgi:hypothetical protein